MAAASRKGFTRLLHVTASRDTRAARLSVERSDETRGLAGKAYGAM
jgi:hypothetical protein